MSGSIISAEISEIPTVCQKINQSTSLFDKAVAEIIKSAISNVILLARGTSGHAALF